MADYNRINIEEAEVVLKYIKFGKSETHMKECAADCFKDPEFLKK